MSNKTDTPLADRPDYLLATEMVKDEILRCPQCQARTGIQLRGLGGKGKFQFQCVKGDHKFTLASVTGQVKTYADVIDDLDVLNYLESAETQRAVKGRKRTLTEGAEKDNSESFSKTTLQETTPTDDPGQKMSVLESHICVLLERLTLSMEECKKEQIILDEQIRELHVRMSGSQAHNGHAACFDKPEVQVNNPKPFESFPKEVAYRKVSDGERLEKMFTEKREPTRPMTMIYCQMRKWPARLVKEDLETIGVPPFALGDLTFVGSRLLIITTYAEYEETLRSLLDQHIPSITPFKCTPMTSTFDPFGEKAMSLIGSEDPVSLLIKSLVKRHKRAHRCKNGHKKTALLLCIGGEISIIVHGGSHVILNRYVQQVLSRKKLHFVDRQLLLPLRERICYTIPL